MAFVFLPPLAQILQHALPGAMQPNFHRGRLQIQDLRNFLHRIILQFLQNQNLPVILRSPVQELVNQILQDRLLFMIKRLLRLTLRIASNSCWLFSPICQ